MYWLAKLFFLSKCLHVNKRGELNDEDSTSKIETLDELESSRVRYIADSEQKRASARDGN